MKSLLLSPWFAVLGTFISLFGILQAYLQARGAKRAASAAQEAAERTAKRIVGFDASVALSSAVESVVVLSELIRDDKFDEAIRKTIDIRMVMRRFLVSMDATDEQSSAPVIALADYLRVLSSELLNQRAGEPIEKVVAQRILTEHSVELVGVCEQLRHRERLG
jgi:hypothetical protein